MHKGNKIREFIKKILAPKYGYYRFLNQSNQCGVFLDAGCGDSVPFIKSLLPNVYYIGLDIVDFNERKHSLAQKFITSTPDDFPKTIDTMENTIDTIFSLHNLEHCNDREKTVTAMTKSLKNGGMMYMAFPSEKSITFPKRNGTLNYYDDREHKKEPPDFDETIKILEENNMRIIYKNNSYKPLLLFLVGLLLEPISMILRKVIFGSYGTWAFWGFEAVIWAEKIHTSKKNGCTKLAQAG